MIYKLTLKTYPEFQLISETFLESEELIKIINHLNEQSERKISLENFIINKPYGSYSSFELKNGTIISCDIESIEPLKKHILLFTVYSDRFNNIPLNILFPMEYIEIVNIFNDETEKLECCDNYRVALKENIIGVEIYEKAKESGCCGSFDKEYVINEKTFLIGFNYGH